MSRSESPDDPKFLRLHASHGQEIAFLLGSIRFLMNNFFIRKQESTFGLHCAYAQVIAVLIFIRPYFTNFRHLQKR